MWPKKYKEEIFVSAPLPRQSRLYGVSKVIVHDKSSLDDKRMENQLRNTVPFKDALILPIHDAFIAEIVKTFVDMRVIVILWHPVFGDKCTEKRKKTPNEHMHFWDSLRICHWN